MKNTLRRTLVAFLALTMIFTSIPIFNIFAASANCIFALSSSKITDDSTFTVTLAAKNAEGTSTVQGILTYDSDIVSLSSKTKGAFIGVYNSILETVISSCDTSKGKISVGIAFANSVLSDEEFAEKLEEYGIENTDNITAENLVLYSFTFKINDAEADSTTFTYADDGSGKTTELTVQLKSDCFDKETETQTEPETENGEKETETQTEPETETGEKETETQTEPGTETGDKETEDKITVNVGDIVEFGSYPQTEVTDDTLKATLSSIAGSTDKWTSYNYYINSEKSDFMKYKDIELDGVKYRGVYFTSYRPSWTGGDGEWGYQENNGYNTSTIYWFKYEPILWQILSYDATTDTAVVLSKSTIDAQEFYDNDDERTIDGKTVYANNYEYSNIRTWLNNTFYNTAFTSTEKSAIVATTLDNSAYSTDYSQYDSNSTTDNVWLLSYAEAQNADYGFTTDYYDTETRQAKTTDYAKSQGIYEDGTNKCTYWRLRSAGYDCDLACHVYRDGYVYDDDDVDYTYSGVRPALTLHLKSEIVPSCAHAFTDTVTPAKCEKGGYTTHTCTKCGDSYTDTETAALGHAYNDGVITVNPTCTDKGVKTFTCTRTGCTASYTEEIAALGHDIVSHAAKAPTCTEKGYDSYETCTRCSYTTYSEKSALGHAYNDGVVTVNPTCTDKGVKTFTCTRTGCTASYTEEIAALGHDIVSHTAKAPTCTDKGYDAYETCTRCSYTTYSEKSALGHAYNDGVVTVNPTCTDKGVKTFTCTRTGCTASYTEEIAALGHDYNFVVAAPNCTEKGYIAHTCSVCGDSYIDTYTNALGHNIVSHTAKAPTCTEKGYDAYETCTRCSYTTYAEKAATGHSYKSVVIAPTCTEKGYTKYTCAKCGNTYNSDYTNPAGHKYSDFVTITPPTCAEKGLKQRTCTVCGDVVKSSIDALGHVDSDNDNTCDNCGDEINNGSSGKCTHMCHNKSKFVKFFWKIFNFFNKLFKIKQYCSCGAKHW